jgi:hypothetical protein
MRWTRLARNALLGVSLFCLGLPEAEAIEIFAPPGIAAQTDDGMIVQVKGGRGGGAMRHGGGIAAAACIVAAECIAAAATPCTAISMADDRADTAPAAAMPVVLADIAQAAPMSRTGPQAATPIVVPTATSTGT